MSDWNEKKQSDLDFYEQAYDDFLNAIWDIVRPDSDSWDYPAQVLRFTDDMKTASAALRAENARLSAEVAKLAEQNKQFREQLIAVGGALAEKTTECVNLNHNKKAWRDVVDNYIRAQDCLQHDEADLQLTILRAMVNNK